LIGIGIRVGNISTSGIKQGIVFMEIFIRDSKILDQGELVLGVNCLELESTQGMNQEYWSLGDIGNEQGH
jgi:hypothetical protein